jgi:hypothetical protein
MEIPGQISAEIDKFEKEVLSNVESGDQMININTGSEMELTHASD